MGLTTEEVIDLSDEAANLMDEIRDALEPDDDGRRRITRREARKVLRAMGELGWQLLRDILD